MIDRMVQESTTAPGGTTRLRDHRRRTLRAHSRRADGEHARGGELAGKLRARSRGPGAAGASPGIPSEAAVTARFDRNMEVIALRRAGGVEAVQADIAAHGQVGVALQKEVLERALEMKNAEQAVLTAHEGVTAQSTALMRGIIVGGGVFAVIFVALALLAIRRDLSGRDRAETELDRFFDLSIDLFAIADADGYFKRLSPAVVDVLGYTVEEALRISVHGTDPYRRPDTCEGRRAAPDGQGRARRRLRRPHAAQGWQMAHAVVALHAAPAGSCTPPPGT